MKVLSLFDGVSCGRLALEKVGIKIDKYYASEIEKAAIEVVKRNRPDTIHLGDVREVTAESINDNIDLLIGGSPCTGFSFAGKQLNFNDPQSKLFFEFVRLRDELKPKYFFLENVKMKQQYQDVITQYMGVEPIFINSFDYCAQSRQRLYWTNIPIVDLEKYKKKVLVADIIEKQKVDDKYYFSPQHIKTMMEEEVRKGKIKKLAKNKYEIHGLEYNFVDDKKDFIYEDDGIVNPLVAMTPRRIKLRGESARRFKPPGEPSYTLTTQDIHGIITNNIVRTFTPREFERLQTIPDDWTVGYSDSKRYKMVGNAWTVDVIACIFEGMKTNGSNK
jgi:DNA-cytosine methyltransferase